MTTSALVLFSGGQDSTTCLAWALDRYECVETVGFDYGQRHRVELDCRPAILQCIRASFPRWGDRLGTDHVLDISVLARSATRVERWLSSFAKRLTHATSEIALADTSGDSDVADAQRANFARRAMSNMWEKRAKRYESGIRHQ